MLNQLYKTAEFLKKRIPFEPEIGIILGTGLSSLVQDIEIEHEIMFSNIPEFPIATVEFHRGKLIFGHLEGKRIIAMQGRLHYYEGYSMEQITLPVRVMKILGIKHLFLSNAAGALNPAYKKGDLMILEDHINLLPDNPLRGNNLDDFGPRFPDMSCPYDPFLRKKALNNPESYPIKIHEGIYAAVQGPNLETRAEYRYLRTIGADVVGMSTVPEVIVAHHMGLPVFAVSVLTDECFPDNLKAVSIEEIIETAQKSEPFLNSMIKDLIRSL